MVLEEVEASTGRLIRRPRSGSDPGWWPLRPLYWQKHNPKFHLYDLVEPTRRVEDLLAEIHSDPTAIFWG